MGASRDDKSEQEIPKSEMYIFSQKRVQKCG